MVPHGKYKPIKYYRKLTITYEVLLSEQYRSLSATSKYAYTIFLYKRQFANSTRKGVRNLKNNGSIKFPEEEAQGKWGIKKGAFWKSIKQLQQQKIIRVAHKGFGLHNDMNLYELIGIFDGVVRHWKEKE